MSLAKSWEALRLLLVLRRDAGELWLTPLFPAWQKGLGLKHPVDLDAETIHLDRLRQRISSRQINRPKKKFGIMTKQNTLARAPQTVTMIALCDTSSVVRDEKASRF